jgi:bifunctional DNA-binding transcriptional regulator/antitoxin component of YhaV-PrlF toxin-antitoxin module
MNPLETRKHSCLSRVYGTNMVKVIVNNNQYKITIPKDLAEAKGWNKGTKLRFIETPEGTVILQQTD